MRTPFVLRVHDDRPGAGARLARALAEHLHLRGARVSLDGRPFSARGAWSVAVQATTRGLPGAAVSVGVHTPEGQVRWLAPLPVPDGEDEAVRAVLGFLERWGFIPVGGLPAP